MRRLYQTTEFYTAVAFSVIAFASAIWGGLDAGQMTAALTPIMTLIAGVSFKKGMRGE